jgi:hypothetical protein
MGKSSRTQDIVVAHALPGTAKSNKAFTAFRVDSKLGYVGRDRKVIDRMKSGYAGAVARDVVTSPLQALAVGGFGAGL